MTNIQDTLTYADGSPASGRLVIFWRPFVVSNVSVAGGELEFFIVDGHVALTLYANANALPVGSYYNAKYELENGAVYIEQWIVPNVPTANLGQVRVSFPPSPSVIISPLQLSSLNAQPGMFLMWDGSKWVPGYPTTFNINPNYISVVVGSSGSDVAITGSPVALGGVLTINVPDASATARGVVTTGTQSFTGIKTFLAAVNIPGTATVGNLTVTGTVTLPVNSYVPVSRKILTDATLSGGGDLSMDRTFVVVSDTSTQRVRASSAGTLRAARQEFNFISGANATVQVVDDTLNNRINVTVGSLAFADPTTAQGDMLARSTTALTRLAVGTNGQLLVVDLATPLGVKWATLATGVSSFNGRVGAVSPVAGDYGVAQVTGAVPDSRQILTPPAVGGVGGTLSGGGDLSMDRTLAVVNDTNVQRLQFGLGATLIATRHRINFIAGTGINLNLVDDTAVNNQANLTITNVGTGAPTPSIYSVNGTQIGIQSELNLIAGTNVSLAGVNNTGANRVDITITTTGGGAGTVTSVFGRIGAVVGAAHDYTADLVDFAVDTRGTYPNPTWLTSLAWAKITGVPSFVLSTRQVIAGAGLGGGGALSADVTLTANVVSVFGRTGAVTLTTADITAAGGVPATRQILPGTGLSGGGDLSADHTLTVVSDTTTQRLRLSNAGTLIGTRQQINLIQGANVTLTTADDSANNRVNVTVAATTSGLADPTIAKGDLIVRGVSPPATRLPASGTDGWVLTADSALSLGVKWAAAPVTPPTSLTPWTSDIDGAGFKLKNAGNIGVGNDATGLAFAGYPQLIVGPSTAAAQCGLIMACGNASSGAMGAFCGVNYAITAADKRIGHVQFAVDGGVNSGAIQFYTYNAGAPAEKMRITATGNVGIGTTNPTALLETSRPHDTGSSLRLSVTGIGGAGQAAAMDFYDITNGQVMAVLQAASETSYGCNLQFWTKAATGSAGPATERMRITAAGNVGIGTTNPQAALEISGTVPTIRLSDSPGTDYYDVYRNNSDGLMNFNGSQASPYVGYAWFIQGAEKMRITAAGNVGIGMTNPGFPLDVIGKVRASTGFIQPSDAGYEWWIGQYSSGIGEYQIVHRNISTNAWTAPVTILPSGNVGIGTTGPGARFEVKQSTNGLAGGVRIVRADASNYADFYIGGDNQAYIQAGGAGYLTVQTGGNVGIGTAGPGYKLDVAGDVNCSTVFRVGGLPISQIIVRDLAPASLNAVYQNSTGKPMFVNVTATIQGGAYLQLLTDAGNPPASVACAVTNAAASGTTINGTVSGWVMPGHFYKANTPNATLINWIQWY